MSESELSGEHALWSGLVQQRVVRFHDFFHEIRVLGNVRRRLDEFEAYGMAALLAIRKDRVPGEARSSAPRRCGKFRKCPIVPPTLQAESGNRTGQT